LRPETGVAETSGNQTCAAARGGRRIFWHTKRRLLAGHRHEAIAAGQMLCKKRRFFNEKEGREP